MRSCRCRGRRARRRAARARRSTMSATTCCTRNREMVDAVFQINGFNFAGRGQNQGLLFVHFKDWARAQRRGPERAGVASDASAARSRRTATRSSSPSIRRRSASSARRRASISSSRIAAASATTRSSQARDQLLALRAARAVAWRSCARTAWRTTRRSGSTVDREKASALGVVAERRRSVVLDRVGLALRQQLPRYRRPHQEGIRAGRRAVPHEPGGPAPALRAQLARRDGADLGVRDR